MLITVVLAFIVCQLPGALLLLVKTYHALAGVQLSIEKKTHLKIAGNITNLLIQTNASINFILYSAISTKFRRVFYHIMCRRRCLGQSQDIAQAAFSRTDGLQMSSFYGDKAGSKATTMSSYTFRIRVSQRSSRTEVGHGQSEKDTSSASWQPWGGQAGQDRKNTPKQKSDNDCLLNCGHLHTGKNNINKLNNDATTDFNNPCCKRNHVYFIWKM